MSRIILGVDFGDARTGLAVAGRSGSIAVGAGLIRADGFKKALSAVSEASHILAGMPNLYTDCSSSFFALDDRTAVEIIRRYGADRVLFGTDYPMWRAEDEIGHLLSLGLTEDECSAIFAGNVKRLLEI